MARGQVTPRYRGGDSHRGCWNTPPRRSQLQTGLRRRPEARCDTAAAAETAQQGRIPPLTPAFLPLTLKTLHGPRLAMTAAWEEAWSRRACVAPDSSAAPLAVLLPTPLLCCQNLVTGDTAANEKMPDYNTRKSDEEEPPRLWHSVTTRLCIRILFPRHSYWVISQTPGKSRQAKRHH